MWTPGLEPGRRAFQTRALPIELSPLPVRLSRTPPAGLEPATFRLTTGRSVPSELWRLITCCGKGSNLQPRPSEGRARPIELPQRAGEVIGHLSLAAGFNPVRPCEEQVISDIQWFTQDSNLHIPLLRRAPLPIGLVNHPRGTDQCMAITHQSAPSRGQRNFWFRSRT